MTSKSIAFGTYIKIYKGKDQVLLFALGMSHH